MEDKKAGDVSKTTESKEDYLKKVEARIRGLESDIRSLEEKAVRYKDAAKAEIDSQIQNLIKKKGEIISKRDQLKSASGEAWGIMKEAIEKATVELKTAFEKAVSKFTAK